MRSALVLGLILSFAAAPAGARELYWSAISVEARLDADGRLHVAERQKMVFTGDWNGGERTFNLRMRQALEFEGLYRVDESGQEHPLFKGDLSTVGSFDWVDSKTLRWRSRLPSDPPFDHTEITYVLRYTLSNVLIPQPRFYFLDHDFLFPDRPGVIKHYTVRLVLDPPWKAETDLPETFSGGPLAPGRGCIVTLPLTYAAPKRPKAVWFGAPASFRYGLAALLIVAVPFSFISFLRRERSTGRFAPLLPAHEIDESWLQSNVLSLPPEVVGAAWDERTGAPEVAAVLARMVAEGKLESEIKTKGWFLFRRHVLWLKLRVPRSQMHGYEKALIDALFFSGDTTDTDLVRKQYASRGFDPASKIREPLQNKVRSLGGREHDVPVPPRAWTGPVVLAVAGLTLLAVSLGVDAGEIFFAGGVLLVTLNASIWAMVAAARSRNEVARPLRSLVPFSLILVAVLAGLLFLLLTGPFQIGPFVLGGATLLCLAMVSGTLNMAKCRQGTEKILFRKKLAAARQWFRKELAKPAPCLRDEWYPYLLAFGLGPEVDRWFRAFGGSMASGAGGSGAGSGSLSGSSAGGWTGGGGAFGGAGASASWAAAAGAMAAGVSSSSSGSGGGGGGGSSGGGGGGGW